MNEADGEQHETPSPDGEGCLGEASVIRSGVDDREKLMRELNAEISSVIDRKYDAEEIDDEGHEYVFASGQLCGLIFARDLVKGFLCQETQVSPGTDERDMPTG